MATSSAARGLAALLWLAFAAAVALAAVVLLRACGLSLSAFGWNFCPATPPALSAEAERGTELARQVRRLELELERKNLACASLPPPAQPPLELPTHTELPQPQQTALLKPPEPPKPPPAVPAERWDKKDLSLLQGCWRLGRDGTTRLTKPDGTFIEECAVKAGTICFGSDGKGRREATQDCPSTGRSRCVAPITARFGDDGFLPTKQPQVMCEPPVQYWWGSPRNDLTCRRVSDDLVMCGSYEFRR